MNFIISAIGNTPMVELKHVVPPGCARILVKLESANPTGSMKDRMAKVAMERAVERGLIRPGDTVVEYTGGSTGVSLSFVCAAMGYRFHAVTSDAFSLEKRLTMKAYGAVVDEIESDQQKITQELIRAMIAKAKSLSQQEGHWWFDQLNNTDAAEGYYPMGEEIFTQSGDQVDAFVHSIGTAHSIHGVSYSLRKLNPEIQIIAVEPSESSVLSGNNSGSHKIEGIGIGFLPPLWHPELVDEILTVSTEEAMKMARRLAKEEAIFGGTSSGANVVAAIKIAERLGSGKTVATLIVDSGLKYVSTALYQNIQE